MSLEEGLVDGGVPRGGDNLSRSAELRRQHSSHWHVPKEHHVGMDDSPRGKAIRAGFVRKVYGILAVQMLITCSVCMFCMFFAPARDYLSGIVLSGGNNSYFQLILWIPTFVSLIIMMGTKHNYPCNFYSLFFFTLCMSLNVGMICAAYAEMGAGMLIAEAAGLTAAIFIGLSLYAAFSGQDFSFMGAFLFASLCMLCAVGLFAMLFGFQPGFWYSVVGALIFCGYIVYDTWRVMKVFGVDDYIMAAIELYLDIVNLFLYILQMLSKK